MFSELSFHELFLFLSLTKCVWDESSRGDLVPTIPKGPKLVNVVQTEFCVHR